ALPCIQPSHPPRISAERLTIGFASSRLVLLPVAAFAPIVFLTYELEDADFVPMGPVGHEELLRPATVKIFGSSNRAIAADGRKNNGVRYHDSCETRRCATG